MIYKAAKLTRPDGKMWHIGLDENDIGKHVILPADPARCEMVAKHFLDGRLVSVARGNPTYTGTYHGVPVSVMSTGMGAMATAVCAEELKQIGAKTLIRMGTCGSLQKSIPEGSFVIATGAVRGEGTSMEYIDAEYPAVADVDVVCALRKAAEEYGVKPYVGLIRSHDAFYLESPGAHEGYENRIKKWTDAGILCVENESSALFVVSSLVGGLRAGTILLTGGNLYENYGSMGTSNRNDYAAKVDLMTKITLRAIEIIDGLGDKEEIDRTV
ncbi:MAG: nucleoside phosphorylase [Erysipelotrichales bacterium]|nr:nucleoside phosphorylase [Erysipelotrichales bacterium]